MNTPKLVISLDFELHWGRFDKYDLASNLPYYRNTREAIPRILDLFERYEIHSTWASVGMLLANNEEEWRQYSPRSLPNFINKKFSAYQWLASQSKVFAEGLFAPELVRLILDCPFQELGSHSYSHYYALEQGPSMEDWRADLQASKRIALEKFGVKLRSLVFPRNQYSDPVIKIAGEEGFSTVRTNPRDWFWKEVEREHILKKIFRTGDTLVPLGKSTSYSSISNQFGVNLLPASRLLRPFRKGSLVNSTRISRIKKELEVAIKNNEMYHLWWHPHNFGAYPQENLKILEDLLQWIHVKMETEGLISSTMSEVTQGLRRDPSMKIPV